MIRDWMIYAGTALTIITASIAYGAKESSQDVSVAFLKEKQIESIEEVRKSQLVQEDLKQKVEILARSQERIDERTRIILEQQVEISRVITSIARNVLERPQ